MKHLARHSLPMSNGTGGAVGEIPQTYCGRCKDYFEVDQDWVDRYLAKGVRVSTRKRYQDLGFSVSIPVPQETSVNMREPRLSSSTDFPYGNKRIAYMCVADAELKVLSLDDARTLARRGQKVYAAWPGEWRQDIFLLDDVGPSPLDQWLNP